jgi:hypothetical protein
MKYGWKNFLIVILLICTIPSRAQIKNGIEVWITNSDKSALLAQQPTLAFGSSGPGAVISVDDKQTYHLLTGLDLH